MRILKRDTYYQEISEMYKNALKDGMKNNLGKNNKYLPGFEFKRRNK